MDLCQKCQLNKPFQNDPLVIILHNNTNITNSLCFQCISKIYCSNCKLQPYDANETYYYSYNKFFCEKCFNIKFI